jgi:hypothetical protein
LAAVVAVAVVVAVAADIAFGSAAVDAGSDFAAQNDIEDHPTTRKSAAAVAVDAAAAIEAADVGMYGLIAKPKLVVDAVSGLRSRILFVLAELEQLVVADAVTVAEVADIVVAVVVAAVQLAENTVALFLQCWMMYEETEPQNPKDLVLHKLVVVVVAAAAVAELEQLVAFDVVTAAEVVDIADDDVAVVVQMSPFVDAVGLNSKNNTDCSERPGQHPVLPLSCSYQRYGKDCRVGWNPRSLRHGEGHS